MTPNNCKGVAGTCWGVEDCLLWRGNVFGLCADQTAYSAAHRMATAGELAGGSAFLATNSQIVFGLQAYEQVEVAAMGAWKKLPSWDRMSYDLTCIHQGAYKSLKGFVIWLL